LLADQIKVGAALVCDTEQQVERFVALYHGDTATAVSAVNAEEHDPSACGMASMAYVVSPPLATVRTKHGTFQNVKIIVLGMVTDAGVRPDKSAPDTLTSGLESSGYVFSSQKGTPAGTDIRSTAGVPRQLIACRHRPFVR
jgi:hypothetical protein